MMLNILRRLDEVDLKGQAYYFDRPFEENIIFSHEINLFIIKNLKLILSKKSEDKCNLTCSSLSKRDNHA